MRRLCHAEKMPPLRPNENKIDARSYYAYGEIIDFLPAMPSRLSCRRLRSRAAPCYFERDDVFAMLITRSARRFMPIDSYDMQDDAP